MTALEARQSIQRILLVNDDGRIGPKTLAALHSLIDASDGSPWPNVGNGEESGDNPTEGGVDARSEAAISTLLPKVRPLARGLIRDAAANGIKIVITSANRTYDEQNELYEQGRSKPGNIVTNARGGHSNHNFGLAFDVTVFRGATPVWEGPDYKVVGQLGKASGLTWGGDWESINDEPHFELHPGWASGMSESEMLAELRKRHDSGQDVFA